jgi:FAD-dependent urate hydroxylase
MSVDLEAVVIGAGPHGLSATVHLRRAGVAAHTFGEPMSFWKQMPGGMKLRSNMSATNLVETVGPLSLARYLDEIGESQDWPVPLWRFLDYGDWAWRRAAPDLDRRAVVRLERRAGDFELELDDGERVTARRVAVAAGIRQFEHLPAGFGEHPGSLVSHTAHHPDLSVFAGRRVAVVGAGQSAFEYATLMRERGAAEVEVLVRGQDVVWLRSYSWKTLMGPAGPIVYAPTDVGPLWYSRLVATPGLFRLLPKATQAKVAYRSIRPACSYFVKVRLDDVKLSLGVEVRDAQIGGSGLRLALSDGSSRSVDHLMFGTGYRVDMKRYSFLGDSVLRGLRRADGYPILGRGLESSIERLHFVGAPAAWSFGPVMRFISGSWYAGRAVARAASPRARPLASAGPGV